MTAALQELPTELLEVLRYEWQLFAREKQMAPEGNWRVWMPLAGRGWGKALALDTPLPTPDGWSTMGDIEAGDYVIGADGRPTLVTFATEVQTGRECFRVTFSDGASVIADADHQWNARNRADRRAKRGYRTVTTADMTKQMRVAGERNWQMPAAKPLDLPHADLPIDPWVFGFWLGDGSSACAEVTVSDDDAPHILSLCEVAGHPVSGPARRRSPDSRCQTYPIGGKPYQRGSDGRMTGNGSLHSSLVALGVLRNKHIPTQYLRASIKQREALLSGLIDSDGYVEESTGRVEITSTRRALAEQITELARTLGHRARMSDEPATIDGRVVGRKYRIRYIARSGGGTLERKTIKGRSGLGQPDRLTTRYVESIEAVPSVDVRCIQVDAADSLYLAGRDFLVTHNTRTGSEWIRSRVEGKTPLSMGTARRIALVAETAADARDVMIKGDSGILACTPKDYRPVYVANRRALVWPNGVEATIFSAIEPDQLRGPQFDTAWCDELAKWRYAEYAWDMLQMGLRLGNPSRALVTTTPRNIKVLKDILNDPLTVSSTSSTYENVGNLDPGLRAVLERKYAGTRLGRQEIEAAILDDVPGALWTRSNIDQFRVYDPRRVKDADFIIGKTAMPNLERVVVAVDPPTTSGEHADECGIITAGQVGSVEDHRAHGYVIDDSSCQGKTPREWAQIAVAAYHLHGASCMVAESNQGGEMVSTVINAVDPSINVKLVHARKGKFARAEPIEALYSQGRVHHVGTHATLEDQMVSFAIDGLPDKNKSPDRVDALVYALDELLVSGDTYNAMGMM